jgi:hypothetical protein
MRTARLPVVDWTDAPADLNGLVRFAESWNLVSAHVPSHFKRSLLYRIINWHRRFGGTCCLHLHRDWIRFRRILQWIRRKISDIGLNRAASHEQFAARRFLQRSLWQSQLHTEGQEGEGVLQGWDWSRFPEASYIFQTHTHTHTQTTEIFNFHFPNATVSKIAVHEQWYKIQWNSTYPDQLGRRAIRLCRKSR